MHITQCVIGRWVLQELCRKQKTNPPLGSLQPVHPHDHPLWFPLWVKILPLLLLSNERKIFQIKPSTINHKTCIFDVKSIQVGTTTGNLLAFQGLRFAPQCSSTSIITLRWAAAAVVRTSAHIWTWGVRRGERILCDWTTRSSNIWSYSFISDGQNHFQTGADGKVTALTATLAPPWVLIRRTRSLLSYLLSNLLLDYHHCLPARPHLLSFHWC